ncbi:MAG: acetate--CoA ligase family protein [Gammaproteobacteria bacterium]|nr:acetate--CoA ligase family protein [Gammaproteobacteria bacterium]
MGPATGNGRFLDRIFNPRSVAVIGLSRSAVGSPVSVLTTLEDFGYQGKIYIVNPNMPQSEGHAYRVCATLDELPEPVDLAIVSVAREHVLDALEGCARNGIRAAIVITQGFADADEEGARLQEELVALVRRTGVRVLGPNTIGVSNAFGNFTSSFIEVHNEKTPVGIVSQSGLFMMGHILINNEPAGFSMSADLGNACDIGIVDVLDYYADEENIRVIQCHVEGIEDGRAFIDTASRVSREKPIVVLKAGKTSSGRAAVASHSGAAAGENEVYEAAFRKAGVVTANDAEELRLLSRAFVTYTPPQGKRVAIMSFSGGGAILAVDAIESAGLTLASLSESSREKLRKFFPDWMAVENPVDIWIPVSRDFHAAFPQVLDLILQDEGVDAVVCIYCSYTLPKYADFDSSLYIGEVAEKHPGKPVVCWSYGMDIAGFTKRVEKQGDVMVFRSLDEAATTLAKLADYGRARRRPARQASIPGFAPVGERTGGVLGRAKSDGRAYLFTEALEILEEHGLDVLKWRLATDETDLPAIADELGFPVAMKIVSSDIVHKSDSGGILLGIENGQALAESYHRLRDHVMRREPGADIDGVLVQRMAPEGKELMLGAKRDPAFGPCLLLGAGGIYTEILRDYAFRLVPVSEDEAYEMIAELKISKILEGVRGEPACHLASVVDAILRVSRLVAAHPEIREIDVNPLTVTERQAVVVDALIIL